MTDLEPRHDPDLNRWCRFCAVDCDTDDPEHDSDCPNVAGFGVARGDERCSVCGGGLDVGESYISLPSDHTRIGTPIADIACLRCALSREAA